MEKLVIGLLKSSNSIQIKIAFIDKLIQSESLPSSDYDLIDFIREIESIWIIQNINIIPNDASTNIEKLKSNYDSFQKHFLLIKTILNHFLVNEIKKIRQISDSQIIEKKFQNLLIHFENLIKSMFISNLNHAEDMLMKREDFLLLIVWLRLLSESFINGLKGYQLCANFINILSTINMTLKDMSFNSRYFLYFIQNDSYFCDEYLKFSITFLDLIDSACSVGIATDNKSVFSDDKKNQDNINRYIIESLLETNSILIRKVIAKQIQDTDNIQLPFQQINFKVKLNNLCKIVKAIKLSVNRSESLYELTIRNALNFLCRDFDENSPNEKIDNKLTELFQCFDLNKSIRFVNKFFEVKVLDNGYLFYF